MSTLLLRIWCTFVSSEAFASLLDKSSKLVSTPLTQWVIIHSTVQSTVSYIKLLMSLLDIQMQAEFGTPLVLEGPYEECLVPQIPYSNIIK